MTSQPFRLPWRTLGRGCLAATAIAAAASSTSASAQVAVEGALFSDYRVRGYSMSDGHPAASLSLSFDDPSGFYVGGVAVGTFHDEPEIAGFQADLGYALRLNPQVTLDAGASRSDYYYAYGGRRLRYTDLYLGVAIPHLSARVSYSPDYYRAGTSTLYAEIEGGIEPAAHWSLSAHAGVFTYFGTRPDFLPSERYDWRIGASRRFGATALHLDMSGRVQAGAARQGTDATALVLSLTHGF